jgi:hypothetical protein
MDYHVDKTTYQQALEQIAKRIRPEPRSAGTEALARLLSHLRGETATIDLVGTLELLDLPNRALAIYLIVGRLEYRCMSII